MCTAEWNAKTKAQHFKKVQHTRRIVHLFSFCFGRLLLIVFSSVCVMFFSFFFGVFLAVQRNYIKFNAMQMCTKMWGCSPSLKPNGRNSLTLYLTRYKFYFFRNKLMHRCIYRSMPLKMLITCECIACYHSRLGKPIKITPNWH